MNLGYGENVVVGTQASNSLVQGKELLLPSYDPTSKAPYEDDRENKARERDYWTNQCFA